MTAAVIESPYLESPGALWLRGNLHTHTTLSDGCLSPQETVDRYAALGHDFLALSDHDRHSDYRGLDARGMLLVPAVEVSAGGEHVLVLGADREVEPDRDRGKVIAAALAAGGLAVLCHPNWERHFDHCPFERLLELPGYAGLEVYNGGVEDGPGSALAADKWDRLLGAGRRVWGLATDDCHRADGYGRGWCAVRARERSLPAVMEALRAGSFYASSGVEIESVAVEGGRVRVVAPGAEVIAAVGGYGARLAFAEGSELAYEPGPEVDGFRVECFGRAGRMAWTQSFRVGGPDAERRRALLAERLALRVPRLERAPAPGGDPSGADWRGAAVSDRFLEAATGRPAPVGTTMRCLVAGGRLLLGFECREPEMSRLRLGVRENGRSAIWRDDSLEVFLDAEGRARGYAHVMVSAGGFWYAAWDGRTAQGARELRPLVRVARGAGGWSAEISLALDELGGEPAPGAAWGFNAVRNRRAAGDERFTWSYLGAGGNHVPGRFGRLEFA